MAELFSSRYGYEPPKIIQIDTLDDACKTSVYKGYKQDKIEMRGDRAEMSVFPLYLNTVAAVSYTHLDVYKRQMVNSAPANGSFVRLSVLAIRILP